MTLNISKEHVYMYFVSPCIFLPMLFTNSSPQQLIYSLHGHMMDDLFLMPLLGTATAQPNARRYLTIAFHRNWCHLSCPGPLLITAGHIKQIPVSITFSNQQSETFPFGRSSHFFRRVPGCYQTSSRTS